MDTNKFSFKKNNKPSEISIKDMDLQTPIRRLLTAMGEDPERNGIKETPKRFEHALKHILDGYNRSFEEEAKSFENHKNYTGIISFKNIDFFSLCEHHLLPFFGFVHIAYIPSNKAYLGISKLARAVDIYSKRLQTQEVLSSQIAEALMKHGQAKGVAILIESRHLCAVARGVEKRTTIMSTWNYYGTFKDNKTLQEQFIELIRNRETL